MKILIVEDEMIISEDICMMLEERDYEVVGQAVDYDEAVACFEKEHPDMVLLDINLNGPKSGIDVAVKINELARVPIIYTSSLSDGDTVEKAKKTIPAAYIVKPFKEEQLITAMEIAMSNFSMKESKDQEEVLVPIFNDAIFVKDDHRFTKVKIDDIRYVQKSDNYLELFTDGKNYIIRASLGGFLKRLDNKKFFRTHRSYAINMHYLSDVSPTAVTLGNKEIPLAKSYSKEILDFLNIF